MLKHTIARCSVFTLLGALACGGEKKAAPSMQPTPAAQPSAPAPAAPTPTAAPAAAVSNEPLKPDASGIVHLFAVDSMRFSPTPDNVPNAWTPRIEAKAGKLKIEFKNVGVLQKEVMGHDLVVLKPGANAVEFAQKAMTAKATDYIPSEGADQMLGHTKQLGPGESDTLELDLQPGSYPFLCTFPGHVGLMNGQLVVL